MEGSSVGSDSVSALSRSGWFGLEEPESASDGLMEGLEQDTASGTRMSRVSPAGMIQPSEVRHSMASCEQSTIAYLDPRQGPGLDQRQLIWPVSSI